ncbi:MAG TPA: hypothetical protein VLC79_08410 [Cellvibrio sp.]|nr:hypothetical protein [Cellvibrio sp.]
MKKFISSIFTMLLFVQSAFAQVGDDDLSKIYQLMNDKKYPEALAAHQAFFKDSKGTSLTAVRLSFGLANWAELGKVYPPAQAALAKMAAERKNAIYAGATDFDVFHEYTSINSYLNQSDESIETFLYVEKHFPKQVQTFYPLVEDILIAQKRYDIVKKYANDAIYEFENLRHYRENSLSQLRKGQAGYTLQQINADFDRKYKVLLETTEKIGQQEEASELKRRYDAYMNGNLLRKYH